MKRVFLFVAILASLSCAHGYWHFDLCAQLNGPLSYQNQYIQLENESAYDFGSTFTIELWMNVRQWDPIWQAIITKGDNSWRLQRDNNTGNIVFVVGDRSIVSSGITFVDQWHHVAVVRSGNVLQMYIDGELNAMQVNTINYSNNNYKVALGENLQSTGRYFKGKLDEVRIWNVVRNANQIKLNRYNRLEGTESGLLSYFKLNENSQWLQDDVGTTTATFLHYDTYVWHYAEYLDEAYGSDRAWQFSAGSEKLQFAPLFDAPATQFTAEAWFNPSLISATNKTILYHGDNGEFKIVLNNSTLTASVKLSNDTWHSISWNGVQADQWYHVAYTVDTAAWHRLYINGWEAGAAELSSAYSLWDPGTSYYGSIGSLNGSSDYFKGKIDQVRIWSRALTAGEIWTIRHQDFTGTVTDLLANYQFNETSNRVIFNRSGSVNCVTNEVGEKIASTWPLNGYYFSGNLSEDHVLPAREITVWGNVVIPPTLKLTVSPGATVKFLGHYTILAQGSLEAVGTEADSIRFTVADTTGFHLDLGDEINANGSWNGLEILTSTSSDSTLIDHCIFEYAKAAGTGLGYTNSYGLYSGGAIMTYNSCMYRISNSRFSNNIARDYGGAVFTRIFSTSLPGTGIITNCRFDHNLAIGPEAQGGAVCTFQGTPVKYCTFTDNSSNLYGGAMFSHWGSNNYCYNTISGNHAVHSGGGIALEGFSSSPVEGNRIFGNTAQYGGGMAFFRTDGDGRAFTHATVQSNLISGNTAEYGGGISFNNIYYYSYYGVDKLRNNTIAGNTATTKGGGIYFTNNSSLRFRNLLIWDNDAPEGGQVHLNDDCDPWFQYCDIQGGTAAFGGAGGGAAYNGFYNNCLDLDPQFSGDENEPYSLSSFSPCINRGEPGSAAGDYDLLGNPRTFAGAGTVNAQLDAILGSVDVGAYEDQSLNGVIPYDVTVSGTIAANSNLTIPNGFTLTVAADASLSFAPQTGIDVHGGLQAVGDPEGDYILFTAQDENLGWDGLAFLGENTEADTSYVAWCAIRHGKAVSRDQVQGGLVHVDGYDRLNMSNCILSHGSASYGGAIAVLNSSPQFYGCVLHHNTATSGGGAVYAFYAAPKLVHLTMADNSSGVGPGGVLTSASGDTRLIGSILWNNGDTPVSGTLTVLYCDIEGGYSGNTNLNVDPCFDPLEPDRYLLLPYSPCLNKGLTDLSAYPNLPDEDIIGNPRLHQHTLSIYNRLDIGAYEYPGIMKPTNFSATDGNNNYPGCVYLSWNYVGAYQPNNGFQVFRDGSLLVSVYPQIYNYADNEAIPGQKHTYQLVAYAGAETSGSLTDTGYVKPNGIITGTVTTPNNNPVAEVVISLSPSSGACLQFAPSNSFEVDCPQADLSASFTLEAWVKTAASDFSLLTKLDDSETDLKQLRINSEGHLLYTDGATSLVQESGGVLNDNAWHHAAVTYDAAAGLGCLYLDGLCVGDSTLAFTDTPGGKLEVTGFTGYLDDLRLWNLARGQSEIDTGKGVIVPWNSLGLTGYWAMNEGSGSEVYDATNNAHIAITDAAWSTAEPGIVLGGVTNNWGEYVISQIPYGNYTTFSVTPSKPGHFFQPEQRLITLSQSNISANDVDFTDDSMIPISGRVLFQGTPVPVRGASILLNGSSSIPPTLTDDDGYYVMDVEHGTVCTLSVSYNEQDFDRVWSLGAVTFPQANKHFYDITRTEFVVEVLGGADRYPIGSFDVTLQAESDPYELLFEATPGLWSGGAVIIDNIPPLSYYVTVDPSQTVPDDYFNLMNDQQFQDNKTQALDLRYPDDDPATVDTLSYIWRNELIVSVDWPEEYELKTMDGIPDEEFYVVEQNQWIQVAIRAYEDYSTDEFPGRKTYLTNCDLTINDEMGPLGETEASMNGTSFITYSFAPYLPNIIADPPRGYQNMLEVTAYDPDLQRYAVNTDWAVIQGARPQESTYATTSPEVPFLILHDPPGDKSYSSFKNTSSHSTCVSFAMESANANIGNVTLHLGPDFVFNTGIMFSEQTEYNTIADLTFDIESSQSNTNSYETKMTFTTSEEYKTSEDNQLIGRESDLFIGGALNLIWGLTKELAWNDTTHTVNLTTSVMVIPDGFATHYIYTAKQIELTVIPNLFAIGDTTSAALWQDFLDMNQDNIDNAVSNPNQPLNVSFNAGAGYTFEEENTIEYSHTVEYETVLSTEMGAQLGATLNGVGIEGGYKYRTVMTFGGSTQTEDTTTSTMTYVLADDDETSSLNYQSDYFTVDVKKDPVYGTPVFNLLAGASSNRWEQNTLPRDGVNLSANTYAATGLQEGEEAVFLLYLDNTTQTAEDRRYYLTLHHESNPGGAIVRINGMPLVERMPFDIPPGGRVQAVMTVEQGPYEYEYEDLTLEFYAPGDRGNAGPDGHYFYVYKAFDVFWEPPYSKVSIRYPYDDWIVNQTDEDTLSVILTGYDLSKPTFESILFQYKHPYDPNWLTASEIPVSELEGTDYIIVPWDLSQMPDGEYEIRAGTTDGVQEDYYCQPLQGVIDRSSPELLNPPQPADGILSYGDQIAVQFTEFIDPDRIIMPDAVTLEIVRTSTPVDVQVTRYENTVYLIPNLANYWLENETLRARVSGLYDLRGNPFEGEVVWEFFVNANPVHWVQPKIEQIKALGQTATITTQLVNSGGQWSSFTIDDLPQWLTVDTAAGALLPLDYQTLTFTISNQLGYGTFRDTVYADIPALGREPLIFEISVLANPPAWAATQLDTYDYSMTITGELMLEGELSEDSNDIIGAFVLEGNSYVCRGVAPITAVPYFEDAWQFFLTVHSDQEEGEQLYFRVWDSSACKEHFGIEEEYAFSSGMIYGTPVEPVTIHVNDELFSSLPCRAGWNWLSVNLDNAASMAVGDVLASLNPSANDIIKNQTSYAQYVPGLGWVGDLQTISTTEALKLKLASADELQLTGLLEDPDTTPIAYGSGWNWIGYLPHISLSVNQSLANLANAATGDLVKNQTGYSQYIAGHGWFGSMLFMDPGKGYMLKTANAGSFTYPDYVIPRGDLIDSYANSLERLREPTGWEVDPLDYEYSSCVTSIVLADGSALNDPNILLGAFYGDECRGIAAPVWVVDRWVFFLTQYSNVIGQTLGYKVYLADTGEVCDADELLPFINNQVLGDPLAPYQFHIAPSSFEAPQNLTLQVDGSALTLSWDECSGATSYKVYSSSAPDGEFLEVTAQGVFGRGGEANSAHPSKSSSSQLNSSQPATRERISWTCELPLANLKFFRVTASTQRHRN
jgi:hypothetical protein